MKWIKDARHNTQVHEFAFRSMLTKRNNQA
jgi:hypothetical protein